MFLHCHRRKCSGRAPICRPSWEWLLYPCFRGTRRLFLRVVGRFRVVGKSRADTRRENPLGDIEKHDVAVGQCFISRVEAPAVPILFAVAEQHVRVGQARQVVARIVVGDVDFSWTREIRNIDHVESISSADSPQIGVNFLARVELNARLSVVVDN